MVNDGINVVPFRHKKKLKEVQDKLKKVGVEKEVCAVGTFISGHLCSLLWILPLT